MSLKERRRLGKFATPSHLAKIIIDWGVRNPDDVILDPCAGSGKLLVEAIQRLKDLGVSTNAALNVYGIDIDPYAIKNLIEIFRSDQNFHCTDFLKLQLPTGSGVQNDTQIPFVDVVVCNPPYTRHHQLDQQYKEEIAKVLGAEAGKHLTRQSSIYVYFFIHASQFLKKNGRMAFITPSNFLNVKYGIPLKQFLLENFRIIAIILFSEEKLQIPEALTTTCITLLEKCEDKDHTVKFLKVNTFKSNDLSKVIEEQCPEKEMAFGVVRNIPQFLLDPMEKWNQYFDKGLSKKMTSSSLGNIAKVHRGIATGANKFFTLSDNEVKRLKLELEFLKPVLTSTRNAPFYDFTIEDFRVLCESGKRIWLVSSDKSKLELSGTHVLNYIEEGEKLEIHTRYLTSRRKIWYSSEKRELAPIIFTYMSRGKPRFIYNKAETQVLNTFHVLHPKKDIVEDEVKLKALLGYLNSSTTYKELRRVGHVYGGGLLKIEPKALEELPIIDFDRLKGKDIEMLASSFEQLCISARKRESA